MDSSATAAHSRVGFLASAGWHRLDRRLTLSIMVAQLYRGPLKAILLDWAGTTLDYGCYAPAVVFIEVFKNKGVPITMEEARAPMGAHKRVHIAKIASD